MYHSREMDERMHFSLLQEKRPRNLEELQRHNSDCQSCKAVSTLFLSRIRLETEKILRKNQVGFWRTHSSMSQILTICRIFERVLTKKSWGNIFVHGFLQFTPHTWERWNKHTLHMVSTTKSYCYNDSTMILSLDGDWCLRPCRWSFAWQYINIISFYNLSRSRTTNVRIFHGTKKSKKQTICCRN